MATPSYVPQPAIVRVPVSDFPPLPPPRRLPPRPVEMSEVPREPGFGAPGPDPGFGFLLAAMRDHELVVAPGERREDAHWAVATVGVRRAARAGRAPVPGDIELGRAVLGYDGRAPEPFARWRTIRLWGVHDERDLAQWLADTVERDVGIDRVPEAAVLESWWASLVADDEAGDSETESDGHR